MRNASVQRERRANRTKIRERVSVKFWDRIYILADISIDALHKEKQSEIMRWNLNDWLKRDIRLKRNIQRRAGAGAARGTGDKRVVPA